MDKPAKACKMRCGRLDIVTTHESGMKQRGHSGDCETNRTNGSFHVDDGFSRKTSANPQIERVPNFCIKVF